MENTSSIASAVVSGNEKKRLEDEKMATDIVPEAGCSSTSVSPPPRVPSPMITVSDITDETAPPAPLPTQAAQVDHLTPTRDRKKSPASGVAPRQRKRSQPVRGDLLPDPDKLLSYKHHDKKEDEVLEDPTVPGGHPKPPPEPRQAGQGQAAERKRSTVTFCPVIETIDK
uniref:Uncharacterized protein n=1 Tax=Graphocephala atropunctata TaxID=36148 RepID=A0A1B6MUK3_9HEMI